MNSYIYLFECMLLKLGITLGLSTGLMIGGFFNVFPFIVTIALCILLIVGVFIDQHKIFKGLEKRRIDHR